MDFSNISFNNAAAQPVEVVEKPNSTVTTFNPEFFEDWNDPKWKVQNISLDQLQRSRKTLVKGKPLNDIEHYALIQQLINVCNQHGLEAQIIDMFAANQGSTDQPGIEQDLDEVKRYTEIYKPQFLALGMNDDVAQKEAHTKATTRVDLTTVRRVYTTIKVIGTGLENEDCWTNLAVSYTPTNIQVGVGQMVKICHNQTILGSNNFAYTSTRNGGKAVSGFQGILNRASEWLNEIHGIVDMDRRTIQQLMNTQVPTEAVLAFLGYLGHIRAVHDSSDPIIRKSEFRMPDYVLDNAQLNRVHIRLAKAMVLSKKDNLSAWDLYNAITEEHKPGYWEETGSKVKRQELRPMDFTKVLPQHMALIPAMQTFGLLPQNL